MKERFLLTMVVCVISAVAQLPTGEITGMVTDSSGGAIADATVTLTNTATNAERLLATNSGGIYDATALQPGSWSIRISKTGFRTEVRKSVDLEVSQVARLDFMLTVGDISQTVEVRGASPVLDTETATVGTVVETRRIEELPLNGRNYLQLASLTPGATQYGPGNSIAQARAAGIAAISNSTLPASASKITTTCLMGSKTPIRIMERTSSSHR